MNPLLILTGLLALKKTSDILSAAERGHWTDPSHLSWSVLGASALYLYPGIWTEDKLGILVGLSWSLVTGSPFLGMILYSYGRTILRTLAAIMLFLGLLMNSAVGAQPLSDGTVVTICAALSITCILPFGSWWKQWTRYRERRQIRRDQALERQRQKAAEVAEQDQKRRDQETFERIVRDLGR